MVYFDPLSVLLGLRYTLSRQRSRSVAFISRVAMMGIVLGVALLITVLSVMNGFDKELRERILQLMPQVTLYHAQGIRDWQLLRQNILSQENIIGVSPFVELQGMVNAGKATEPTLIYGVDAELEPTTSIIHEFLSSSALAELNAGASTIILGHDLAKKLAIVIGDTVSVIIPRAEGQAQSAAIARLQVIDVLQTGTEVDSTLALMGLSAAMDLSIHGQSVSGMHIKTKDLFLSSQVASQLQQQLPYLWEPAASRGFYTTDWTRTHGNIYYAIQVSKNLVSLLLLLIVAIAAFNVVSTLVMAVIDKQSDIAILRTMGASSQQVIGVFIIQGTLISVIGTIVGVVLGVLLALSIQDIVVWIETLFDVQFLKSDIYPVSYLPSSIVWFDVLLVVFVSLLMSLCATLYPAWRAAKVVPAEALRYE